MIRKVLKKNYIVILLKNDEQKEKGICCPLRRQIVDKILKSVGNYGSFSDTYLAF